MESVKSIQSFWRRRNYRKIETKSSDERTVTLGDGSRRTSARKLVSVKNKVKISPPKSLLVKLRDSYVGAMFSWSGDKKPPPPSSSSSKKKKNDGKGGRRNSKAGKVSNKISDFDKRMILHIYNTVMEKPREPARITS